MASIRVDQRIYDELAARARAELRSVASLASVILREGLSEREMEAGDSRVAPVVSRSESPGAEPARNRSAGGGEDGVVPSESAPDKTRPYLKECRNSEYHWKGPCRFCGGGEPA